MDDEQDAQRLNQLFRLLDPESRGAALRLLRREARQDADDILNSGKAGPEERPQQGVRASDQHVI